MDKTAPKAIVRFLPDDPLDWDQACIQFQGGGRPVAQKLMRALRHLDANAKQTKDLVYIRADRKEILSALKRLGYDQSSIIDVRAPTPC